jgi:hypothetical protein
MKKKFDTELGCWSFPQTLSDNSEYPSIQISWEIEDMAESKIER